MSNIQEPVRANIPPPVQIPSEALQEIQHHLSESKIILPFSENQFCFESIEQYASDETEDFIFCPAIVLKPETTQEVAWIVKLANRYKIPITPRGAGTGLSGGSLPIKGGICLSLEKMNRIIEIDTQNLCAIVQPGVVTERFQTEVEKLGLFYPPDPASRGSCMIGGNLAECSGGPRAVKYGVTKDYVLGVQAVMPDGSIIRHGGKLLKNVTGYNLSQLLVGSEGTLGIITEVTFKLIPLPKFRQTLLVPYNTLHEAAKTVSEIFKSGITPSACEFMENDAIQAAENHLSIKTPLSTSTSALLIEIDGNYPDILEKEREIICQIALENNATDVILADSEFKQKEIWRLRRATGEAVKKLSVYKEEDTVVPRYELPNLVLGVKQITESKGIKTICYGHAGDGNLHVNILKMNMTDKDWNEKLPSVIEDIFKLTIQLGGTLSGEHGIGYSQKRYMTLAFTSDELRIQKNIKTALDPNGIMNPEKIFPDNI